MHELAIAQTIFERVRTEMQDRGLPAVEKVFVRVGALSGVLPDALDFSFEAIRADTELADCGIEIEEVPITVECGSCRTRSTVDDFLFVCPRCESVHVNVIEGYELEIAGLEVPDAAVVAGN